MTTLAGSAQGYKDGIGENANFRHTSGEEFRGAGIIFVYLFKRRRKAAKSSVLKRLSDNFRQEREHKRTQKIKAT